ncbi:class I SAM-dependent methyltransferase [Thermoflexus sp.]|uniref:class I SAM-dependent methyltransferase n=1 Tax=Thermoflexus sp. TaxID=1969742 RepID=UPI00176CA65A
MRMKYQREYWSKWERVKDPYLRQRKAWKIQAVLEEAVPGIAHWNGWALDIGCSTGRITEHFAQLWPDWHVIGVDIDEDALHWATAHRHYAYFCFGDAMRLPFPNDSFDLIICAQVYEHVPDWRCLLQEIHRVLRPGGVCFFSGPNRWFPIEEHYGIPFLSWFPRFIANRIVRWISNVPFYYENPVSWWTLRKALRDCGFQIEDYTYRLLENPSRFRIEGWWTGWISRCVRGLPKRFRRSLTLFLPNFNLIIRKPSLPFKATPPVPSSDTGVPPAAGDCRRCGQPGGRTGRSERPG